MPHLSGPTHLDIWNRVSFKQEQGHLVQAGAFLAPGSSYQLPALSVAAAPTAHGDPTWDARDLFWLFPVPSEPMPRTESAHERVKEGLSR